MTTCPRLLSEPADVPAISEAGDWLWRLVVSDDPRLIVTWFTWDQMHEGPLRDPRRQDFSRDTRAEDQARLRTVLEDINDFCVNKAKANCFLVEKDIPGAVSQEINELVDLKFLHRAKSRVTVRSAASERSQVWNDLEHRGRRNEARRRDQEEDMSRLRTHSESHLVDRIGR